MYILGLSVFYHDSVACLLKVGDIIAAVPEERLLVRNMLTTLLAFKLCIATPTLFITQ